MSAEFPETDRVSERCQRSSGWGRLRVFRGLSSGLVLLLLTIGAGVISAGDEPIGIDPAGDERLGVDPPAAPLETPAEEKKPVELIPLGRIQGNLDLIQHLAERCDQLTGSSDWRDESPLMEILQDEQIGELQKSMNGRPLVFRYDLFLTVPTDGSDDFGMAVAIVLPVGKAAIGKLIADSEPDSVVKEDADGFGESEDFSFLFAEDYSALLAIDSGVSQDARRTLQDAVAQMRRNVPRRPIEVIIEPLKVRKALKAAWLQTILATLYTDLQQRDNEDTLTFQSRATWGKSVAALLDVSLNQIHSLTYALEHGTDTPDLKISLEIAAVEDSPLDEWIQRQQKVRSRILPSLHPDHSLFFSVCLATPELLQESLPLLGKSVVDSLVRSGLIDSGSGLQIQSAVAGLAAMKTLEFLVQCVPDANGRHMVFASLPLPENVDLTSATIQLIHAADSEGWQIAFSAVDSWPVHLYADALSDADPHLRDSIGSDLQLIATDRQVTMQITSAEGRERIGEVAMPEFPESDEGRRFRRCGLAMQCQVLQLMRLLDGDDQTLKKLFGTASQQQEPLADRMTVSLETEPHRLILQASFGEQATAAGLVAWSQAALMLAESISDFISP